MLTLSSLLFGHIFLKFLFAHNFFFECGDQTEKYTPLNVVWLSMYLRSYNLTCSELTPAAKMRPSGSKAATGRPARFIRPWQLFDLRRTNTLNALCKTLELITFLYHILPPYKKITPPPHLIYDIKLAWPSH